MAVKKFKRTKEDFICKSCGFKVGGDGYTNHCPSCLWSRHVDVNPGDRQSDCEGMMEPIGVEMKKGNYVIIHQCVKCGFKKKNKTGDDDNFEKIIFC